MSETQFQVTIQKRNMTFRAASEEEMQSWLNVMMKQKVMIEEIIDGIEI
jgi:hypothetical protein